MATISSGDFRRLGIASASEKVILRLRLLEHTRFGSVRQPHNRDVLPWEEFFENAAAAFERAPAARDDKDRGSPAGRKLERKHEVLSEVEETSN